MPDARIEGKLYRIAFLVLDGRSDSKALIISNTESMIRPPPML